MERDNAVWLCRRLARSIHISNCFLKEEEREILDLLLHGSPSVE